MRHINEPPPPIRDKRPDVSPRLEAAVQRAMAKRPEDRFDSMIDFCHELEANLQEAQGTLVSAPAPKGPRTHRQRRRGANPWPIVVALAVLIAIGGVIAYLVTTSTSNSPSTSSTSGGGGGGGGAAAVHVKGVNAFDPLGDGQEHGDRAGLATDRDGNTYWETEHYQSAPSLGKAGVGLVLDAGSPVQLHRLGIATSTPGFVASIKAGNSESGPFDATVAPQRTVNGQTQYVITATRDYRYYLIWITRLGPNYNTARINEVSAT
jgi:hypothetical protein